MRFLSVIVLATALLVTGCGGEEGNVAPATDAGGTAVSANGTAHQGGPVADAPITGKIHEVKMMGDGKGYRFEPKTIRAEAGDGVRFVMHSFGPHNIVFDSTAVPADQRAQLYANMRKPAEWSSPMVFDEDEAWELSLGNLKPGKYPFFCSPHLGANMTGEIIIE